MGDVAHMADEVGVQHLLQRGAEGGDKLVGRSEMKPTVSDRITSVPSGSFTARMVGSSVAKSMSLAITSAPVRRLKSVDLPALV
jgi:hypothetical protein